MPAGVSLLFFFVTKDNQNQLLVEETWDKGQVLSSHLGGVGSAVPAGGGSDSTSSTARLP